MASERTIFKRYLAKSYLLSIDPRVELESVSERERELFEFSGQGRGLQNLKRG